MGLLLVVSGPSGVGKGTIIEKVRGRFGDLKESVSVNTRPPRPDEVEGRDYFFVTRQQFEEMIAADEFYEWANVHGELKGTPKREIRKALEGGVDMVLEVDYQGALAIKNKEPSAVLVFIAPPTWADLEQRLRGRETESSEALQRRLQTALIELQSIDKYDYVIVNDHADEAADELAAVLVAERCRLQRRASQALVASLLAEARAAMAGSE
jgi:guanylate kinase